MLAHHGTGNDGDTPELGASAGFARGEGSVRELRPSQRYHYRWYLLRQGRGMHGLPGSMPAFDALKRARGERPDDANTIVLGCFVGGHMRGAIQLRCRQSDWGREAEVVVSVETAWQGRGIGRALMAEAIATAQERGIVRLYLSCHALNRRMQQIAEAFDARIEFEDGACFAEFTVNRKRAAPQ